MHKKIRLSRNIVGAQLIEFLASAVFYGIKPKLDETDNEAHKKEKTQHSLHGHRHIHHHYESILIICLRLIRRLFHDCIDRAMMVNPCISNIL